MPLEKLHQITEEEYLKQEQNTAVKHEYIDGCIVAMAGASKNHGRIIRNLLGKFDAHLAGSPCEPFSSDLKVKAGKNYFYPDVVVDCDSESEPAYFASKPTLIIEVTSRSTRHKDRSEKLLSYLNIESLQEYVLIDQDVVSIDVFRRNENWILRNYALGDKVLFNAINLELSVEDIYHRVINEEMTDFLKS